MGLIGKYKEITFIESETETDTVSVTYPESLLESDPNYELRGTTVLVEQPRVEEVVVEHENAYANVTHIEFFKQYEIGNSIIGFDYNVYSSVEQRNNDPKNPIFKGNIGGFPINLSEDNVMEKCYEYLKMDLGFNEMSSDTE